MPTLLRQLRKRNKWQAGVLHWLLAGEIPADPLDNLSTSENTLSVYEVASDDSTVDVAALAKVERIAAATAAGSNSNKIDEFEYIIFSQAQLEKIGIKINPKVPGATCDAEVNSWHRDLVELSGEKLLALAHELLATCETDVILPKRIEEVAQQSVQRGKIQHEEIANSKLRKQITSQNIANHANS